MKTTSAEGSRRDVFFLLYGDMDGIFRFMYDHGGDRAERLFEFTMFAQVVMERVGEIDNVRG